MASTPSASALTSVLRCRGTLWTRNPPSKRSSPSAYGPALAGGTRRDSPGRGESLSYRLSVRYDSPSREGGGAHRSRELQRSGPEAHAVFETSNGRPGGARQPAAGVVIITRLIRPCQMKVFVREICEHRLGFGELCRDDGQMTPSFVETRWSTLRSTCRSLQLLLTHIVLRRLAILCGCGRGRQRKRNDSGQKIPKNGSD
nr:uncharacterized protein LOC125975251 isoform X2 [Syngnathus scovelli]